MIETHISPPGVWARIDTLAALEAAGYEVGYDHSVTGVTRLVVKGALPHKDLLEALRHAGVFHALIKVRKGGLDKAYFLNVTSGRKTLQATWEVR